MKPQSPPQQPILTAADFQRELIALIPFLRGFAHSICRVPHQGEDLAQEALVKAWKAKASFQPGTNLKAWLFTILRNEYYSRSRRSWRQSDWDEAKAERIAAAPDAQYWSMALCDTANALHQLPASQREALVLVAAGGFSYEEAAEICQTAVGTVKSRVARGRAAMIQLLDGEKAMLPRGERIVASDYILGQLSALTPAEARRPALL